jgi:hypothetical protein
MKVKRSVSNQTKNNWLLDAGLFISAVLASISGIYFLFFVSGGYQGGRNPTYGVRFLMDRSGWDTLHTWGGVIMIVVALAHLIYHWHWVVSMTRRVFRDIFSNSKVLNAKGRWNVFIDVMVAAGFTVTAISGVYFLFAGSSHGGRNPDPMFLFSRAVWDSIHTWAGVVMIIAAVIHFAIHWRWVVNVTKRVFSIQLSGKPVTAPQMNRLSEEMK